MSLFLNPVPTQTPLNAGSSMRKIEDGIATPDMGLFTTYWNQWFQQLRQIANIVGAWITGTAIDGSFVEDPAWTDWTPTIDAGAATVTTTTLVARYMPHGKSIYFAIHWVGQLTVASVSMITFTPPVDNKAGIAQSLSSGILDSTFFPGAAYASDVAFKLAVFRPTGNFTLSSSLTVLVAGVYEAV